MSDLPERFADSVAFDMRLGGAIDELKNSKDSNEVLDAFCIMTERVVDMVIKEGITN